MMFYCPFCGARRFTCWPEFWPWQYKGDLFCSENCWICDSTRKEMERNGYRMSKKFILTKEQTDEAVRKYKEEGRQAAIVYLHQLGSKDPMALWNSLKKRMNVTSEGHTKAKKPTIKLDGQLRIETPEAHNVDIVETPETVAFGVDGWKEFPPKGKQISAPIKYKVTGIATEVGEFWVVSGGKIKWIPGRFGKEDPVMQVMMTTTEPALTPDAWRQFARIILDVIDLLEVET